MLLHDAARGELDCGGGVLSYVTGDNSAAAVVQTAEWHKFNGLHASGPRPPEQGAEKEAGTARQPRKKGLGCRLAQAQDPRW